MVAVRDFLGHHYQMPVLVVEVVVLQVTVQMVGQERLLVDRQEQHQIPR
jgi:hypothetical protein